MFALGFCLSSRRGRGGSKYNGPVDHDRGVVSQSYPPGVVSQSYAPGKTNPQQEAYRHVGNNELESRDPELMSSGYQPVAEMPANPK